MYCKYCGNEIPDNSRFCTCCGADLRETQAAAAETHVPSTEAVGKAAGALVVLGSEARKERLAADYSGAEIISGQMYNLIIGGCVLWGLLVNVWLCSTVRNVFQHVNPIVFYILYIVLCFAGIRVSRRSQNPAVSFLGYNMIVVPMGLLISGTVNLYLGVNPSIVTDALLYTLLISAGMTGASMAFPELFSKLGGMLLGALLGLFLCEILLLIFRVQQNVTDWICAGIFSLYIGFDIWRSQQFVKTVDNAVDCALDIYLDIINLFVRLLSIISRRKN